MCLLPPLASKLKTKVATNWMHLFSLPIKMKEWLYKILRTVFPRLETAVTKDFSSTVPRFQFEGRLLYEGRLLILHQVCGLLYNICTHAILFARKRFRPKIQTFLYECAFRFDENGACVHENGENAHENGENAHENVSTSKTVTKMGTFETLKL